MKKQVIFTIADKNNEWMIPYVKNSLRKFHSEEELPFIVYGQKELDAWTDPDKFYKATPHYGRKLLEEYETVIKIDVDSIVTGSLDFILSVIDYDIGTVRNFSRQDLKEYGPVTVWDIHPTEYYNAGFVVMRSKEFCDHWNSLCNSPHFTNYQMREQDLLNIICFYGNYKVRCFDVYDPVYNYGAWHSLLSKGEWNKIQLVIDGGEAPVHYKGMAYQEEVKLLLPKGTDNYPDRDEIIKIIHWAGGSTGSKMNYKSYFQEPVIKYLNYLISDGSTT